MAKQDTCSSCRSIVRVESVTVRVYCRRSQVDYRYKLCVDCKEILRSFLAGSAQSIQRGLFDHTALLPSLGGMEWKR